MWLPKGVVLDWVEWVFAVWGSRNKKPIIIFMKWNVRNCLTTNISNALFICSDILRSILVYLFFLFWDFFFSSFAVFFYRATHVSFRCFFFKWNLVDIKKEYPTSLICNNNITTEYMKILGNFEFFSCDIWTVDPKNGNINLLN